MRYAWPVLAIFSARFFSTAYFFSAGDADLAWQRWLGRTILESHTLPRAIGYEAFTAPGAPWVPQEWLFSIVAALSTGPAWSIFATAAALGAVAALWIGALRAQRSGATPLALVLALLFAGFALCEAFGVRAQVFAWPLLALFLYLIEFDSPLAYGAIAVAVVWSNVHASVMLAGPLALAAATGSYLDERWSSRTKRTLAIGCASLVATCCTPLGLDLPRYAIALFSSPFKAAITEWQHTDFSDASFAFGSLPLLLALGAFGIAGSARWRDRGIVLLTAGLMFFASRNIAIFAIASFPIVARSLCAGASCFARREQLPDTKIDVYAARLFPVLSLVLAVIVARALVGGSPTEAPESANLKPALAVVRSLPGTHRVLCADFAWCSFLLGDSRERVFLDGRADPYPPAVWHDFITIVRVKSGWAAALRSRGTDVIVVRNTTPLEQVLELSADWRTSYRNSTYRVWTLMPAIGLRTRTP